MTRWRIDSRDDSLDRLCVPKDTRLRIVVIADVSDHVHVHGYDLMADVAPGRRRPQLHRGRDRPLRDRARGRGRQIAQLTSSLDLPPARARDRRRNRSADPDVATYYGAAAVLVLSFAALGALWKRPRLEDEDRAAAVVLNPTVALRVVFGAIGFALFLLVFFAALAGDARSGTNIAPTFVYVAFWLGLVPLVVVFGNVWRWLNPWRAAADAAAWLWSRSRLEWDPPFAYPERLGRWPAAALLFCFAALGSRGPTRRSPRARARDRDLQLDHLGRGCRVRRATRGSRTGTPSPSTSRCSRLSPFVIEDGTGRAGRRWLGVARHTDERAGHDRVSSP